MYKKKQSHNYKVYLFIPIGILLAICILFWWIRFESHSPKIVPEELPDHIGKTANLSIKITDNESGIKLIEVFLTQGKTTKNIFKKEFSRPHWYSKGDVKNYTAKIKAFPKKLGFGQGEAKITIKVLDHSLSHFGKGNESLFEKKVDIDTVPPMLRLFQGVHYLKIGGSGYCLYKTSEDAVEGGIRVGEHRFKGFPFGEKDLYHVLFAIPCNLMEQKGFHGIFVYSIDQAGNEARRAISCRLMRSRFKKDKIHLSLSLIKKLLLYFQENGYDLPSDPIKAFVIINEQEREKDHNRLHEILQKHSPAKERLWKGAFKALPNAKRMAGFGDRRDYIYNNKVISKSVHLGIDLASIANAAVPAANNGVVIFTGPLGIYGETVIIDHGMGLHSMYSHLSQILVQEGETVKKGNIIGHTGSTGLAGGDHLHFSILVDGVFVNPLEWLDARWIKDHILLQEKSVLQLLSEERKAMEGIKK